jgi:hypothetical protein
MQDHTGVGGGVMILSTPTLMVLYHTTVRSRVPQIRRKGLKPHVPGKVWGRADPAMTRNKPVVWLTADPATWPHAKHPNKAFRDPDKVLLRIQIWWNNSARTAV